MVKCNNGILKPRHTPKAQNCGDYEYKLWPAIFPALAYPPFSSPRLPLPPR